MRPVTADELATHLEVLGLTLDELVACTKQPTIEAARMALEVVKKRARKALKKLAIECHPDVTGGDEEKARRLSRATEAYRVIDDLRCEPPRPPPQVVRYVWTQSYSTTTTSTSTWGYWP